MTDLSTQSPFFAAVDLGSNSFHMLIARFDGQKLQVIDREKDMVQIARGLSKEGVLSEYCMSTALGCLMRFGERLRVIPNAHIRAVGTKTLRSASNNVDFLKQAENALGAPIQIISGYEEARLIYTGLYNSVAPDQKHRLVMDIGGASTELALGSEQEASHLESLSMGCVSFTKRFELTNHGINETNMRLAYFEACAQIEEVYKPIIRHGWDIAFGTSGTMKAIAELTQEKDGGAFIRKESLMTLKQQTLQNRGVFNEKLPQLRRDVLPAGIAILSAIFDQLNLDTVHVDDSTLKEGLIYDTIGRFTDHDTRVITVEKLANRYNIDTEQGERVKDMALFLWKQVDGPALPGISRTKILGWAGYLHEIGLNISHSAFHRHGHYLLQCSDLAGFSRYEQLILAKLVLCHRKKIDSKAIGALDTHAQKAFLPLLVCLRIATILARRREKIKISPKLSIENQRYVLQVTDAWLKINPLTHAGLRQEMAQLMRIDCKLDVITSSSPL